MNKVDKIIEELELAYTEFTGISIEERKKTFPLKNKRHIKGLIWNLLTSDKYRSKISYNDYSKILEVFFERLK